MEELLAQGLRLFNAEEFFECHEVLELAWTPEHGPRRLFLQALIHVAVACHHSRRGNPEGSVRQLRKALRKLAPYLPECEEVDTARLERDARAMLEGIEADMPVTVFPRMHRVPAQTPAVPR